MLDYHDEVFEGPFSADVSRKTSKRKSHKKNKETIII